ncbi:membrane protein insertion efficiency factor YidD [Patescibacteria group bacterium]|nr:membrane protein insertion efficiency factor YidD [Patescibacteria group bacterium]MBU1563581.1 membrane protein insertion efficiency factor YidD [Patescibacteria group bacterium]
MKYIVLFLIKVYQKTISPDHGYFPILRVLGQCRHYPTCSQYTVQAVKKHGAFKGLWLGLKRVVTCHPWGN